VRDLFGDSMTKKRKHPKLRQCHTVGELLIQLKRLPSSMPVKLLDDGVVLVPVNVGHHDEHLDIDGTNETCWEPGEDWVRR
jgi:hypothetical protein